jgi:hypothetical protein
MAIAIVIALLTLPVVFLTIGFVASSTLLFTTAATALRGARPSARSMALDLAVGAGLSMMLFLAFTRGLSVSLPGGSLF